MKELPDLKQLTSEGKDALIQSLWEEILKLRKGSEKRPKKTSKNSSLPPSQGFKSAVKAQGQTAQTEAQRAGSIGREGGGRALSEHPDQVVKAHLQQCEACGVPLSEDIEQLMQRYDKIEIPPIRPVVTRVER